MNEKGKIVTFNILGEEYKLKTDMDEETTKHIADYVNKQIEGTIKKVGYASQTKIAVLSALNIARELFLEKIDRAQLEEKIQIVCKRLEEVLTKK